MSSVCGTLGEEEKCIESFGGETWGSRPLGRTRHRWQDSMKMDIREIRGDCGGLFVWLRTGTSGGL
jgi:hypothetical protein